MKTEDDLKIINFIKKNPDFVKRNRAYFSGLLNDLNNSKKILQSKILGEAYYWIW